MRIVVATRNRHKLEELRRMLAHAAVDLVALDDVAPDAPEIEEPGATFADNAVAKALAVHRLTGLAALADDSGLEVDALGGAPGIRSARYAGGHGDSAANMALLLSRLEGVEDARRTARFRCAMALAHPRKGRRARVELFEGVCEGSIIHEPRGTFGFGYDPVFLVPGSGQTMAELSAQDKDRVSHRGRACRELERFLVRELGLGSTCDRP